MNYRPFHELFEIPLRNGLTKPKRVRGEGCKMINMGELFKHPRMKNIPMDRVPLNEKERAISMVAPGDLLFARQSLVVEGAGQCSIFIEDDEDVCFESHLIRCRLDKKIASPLFYYYFFSSVIGKQIISAIVEQGAGAAGIRGSDLTNLLVPHIDIKLQNKIVSALDSLDNKIAINQQINQTLEGIAQALFKSWFVDFEPVRAKVLAIAAGGTAEDANLAAMQAISGKTPAELATLKTTNPSEYKELHTTASLFPHSLTPSELGDIPTGWRYGKIGDVATAKGGYAFKGSDFLDSGLPVVKIKNITGDGRVELEGSQCINEEVAKKASRFKLADGDLLMAMTGATVGKVGFIVVSNAEPYLNQRVAKFESEKFGQKINWFLYCCFQRDSIFSSVVGAAQGSAQPNISSAGIESTEILLPTDEILNAFCNYLEVFFRKWIDAIKQSQTLTQIRDSLLPKLLSGEIDVSTLNLPEI